MFENTTKNLLIGILFVLIFICFIGSSHADPTIMVTNFSLEPKTLLPGDSAELSITLTNTEASATHTDTDYINGLAVDQIVETIAATIDDVWISPDGDGSYSISAEERFEDIGDLSPGSSITISFTITAHQHISSGLYNPIVNVDVVDYQDVQFPIPIRVSSFSATLLPKNVPKKISSSGSTTITLTIVNNREATVEDVIVTANNNQSIAVSPVSTYIGTLESQASEDISCSLHPNTLGHQNISFTLSYRNGENTHTMTIIIPIEVIETHDVSPVIYQIPSTIQQHTSERITIEVYNAKSDTITGVTVIPVTNLTTSPSEYFIGSMNSDDVFSASFNIHGEDSTVGNYSLGFKVSFKQDNNYFESPTISNQVEVVPFIRQQESIGMGMILSIIGVFLIGTVIIYYLYKKRRIRK